MWIAEISERAILTAMSELGVTFRASRVDDENMNPSEHKRYPTMIVIADGGTQEGNAGMFYQVPVTITLATLIVDDEKRTVLARLEDEMRKILDAGIKTEFDAVAVDAGETWYYKGLTEVTGGPVEITEKEQIITTTMTFRICGS